VCFFPYIFFSKNGMLTYTTQQVVLEKPLSFRVHKIATTITMQQGGGRGGGRLAIEIKKYLKAKEEL
jgi:hypothetical protein